MLSASSHCPWVAASAATPTSLVSPPSPLAVSTTVESAAADGVADGRERVRGQGRVGLHYVRGSAARRRAASSVFWSSIAIVIGPTPPGTGVIAPATSATASKSTSPTRR